MVVFSIATVITLIGGTASWLNSFPATFKYIIFLSAFFVDVTIAEVTGFGDGFIVMPINLILQEGFGFPIVLTSFQLLIVFIMLPIMFYALRH